MMESSCFICGVNTVTRRSARRPGNNCEDNLKDLLSCLCRLLSVTEIGAEDWDFSGTTGGLEERSLCCAKCYDLLKNVESLHDIIVQTEKQLQIYLDQVKTLIVKSEEVQSLESGHWTLTCFDFRRSILNKVTESKDDDDEDGGEENDFTATYGVKEEFEAHQSDADDFLNLDDNLDDNHWDGEKLDTTTVAMQQEQTTTEIASREITENKSAISDENQAANKSALDFKLEIIKLSPWVTLQKIDSKAASRKSPRKSRTARPPYAKIRKIQKNKVKEIGEDEEVVGKSSSRNMRASRTRRAKKSAKAALKQYISSENEEDGDGDNPDCDHEDSVDSAPEEMEAGEYDHDNESSGTQITPEIGEDYVPLKKKKITFYPLMVAGEDLYLYRFDTFVRKTYTHLQCLAYQCNFQTKFDYYPSFDRLKRHLETNHRSRKHTEKVPHPCYVCNGKLFPNWRTFWIHSKKEHNDIYDREIARQVCVGCLKLTRYRHGQVHFFTHKNEQELAEARAKNVGPLRCLKLKDSERTEREFVCDYELWKCFQIRG